MTRLMVTPHKAFAGAVSDILDSRNRPVLGSIVCVEAKISGHPQDDLLCLDAQ